MSDIFKLVPLKNLVPSKTNYRKTYDEEALKELTDSVKEKGIIEPLLVRALSDGKQKGRFEVVAGSRRLRAATAAKLKEVPCVVKKLTDEEALEIQVIENTQRENPNPIDEAMGFKRLIEIGKHTPDTLAERIGHSTAYVLSRLKLADLDKTVQEKIAGGEVGLGHAVLFTRLRNTGDQKEFLKFVLSDEPSIGQAKEQLQEYFALELKDASFDTSGCASCNFRSRNQAVLFPDLSKKDECTDRSCYYTKSKQSHTALLKQKAAEGFKTFTDKKDIEKLIRHGAKGSRQIGPDRRSEGNNGAVPPKYKSECAGCTGHHAFFFYEDKNWNGQKVIKSGEICLDTKCLDRMLNAGKKAEKAAMGEENESKGANPHTLRAKARECRNRFLLEALAPKVETSLALKQRLAIHHIISHIPRVDGSWRDAFIKEYNPYYRGAGLYYSGDKVYRGIAGIPAERLDLVLLDLVHKTFPMTDADIMLQMTPEAGIDMVRDFIMDEEYLNGKTKDELKALALEIWPKDMPEAVDAVAIAKSTGKKGDIVKAFLAQDLVGKVPAVVAEVCRLDTKDDDEDVNEPVGNWCDECGEEGEDCTCEGGPPSGIEEDPTDEPDPDVDPMMPATTKTSKRKPRARA